MNCWPPFYSSQLPGSRGWQRGQSTPSPGLNLANFDKISSPIAEQTCISIIELHLYLSLFFAINFFLMKDNVYLAQSATAEFVAMLTLEYLAAHQRSW